MASKYSTLLHKLGLGLTLEAFLTNRNTIETPQVSPIKYYFFFSSLRIVVTYESDRPKRFCTSWSSDHVSSGRYGRFATMITTTLSVQKWLESFSRGFSNSTLTSLPG